MQWIGTNNLVPLLCIAAIAGAAGYSLVAPMPATLLDVHVGERVEVVGTVVRDPDVREKMEMLTVEVDGARVLVSTDRLTAVAYGDRVVVIGKLELPQAFETDTGRSFNYPQYLRAHGIRYQISFAELEIVAHNAGNPIVASLLSVKHLLVQGIERALSEPESALLAGLLIGDKQSLGDAITEAFRNAGVAHIIVLSGYNVSLVMNAVLVIALAILPRRVGYALAALFVIGFAVMTGGSETTIRAVLMALIMMLASILHRPKAALRALLIAAALMAIHNPFIVLFDLSFQLSILATFGLIVLADRVLPHLVRVPKVLGLREIMASTLATQVTVLPLLILSVGRVSLVFLASNLLILPAVPIAMLTGFVAALAALVSPTLSLPLSAAAYAVLHYIIVIATWFGSLPFASVAIPQGAVLPLLIILGIIYAAVVVRVLGIHRLTRRRPA